MRSALLVAASLTLASCASSNAPVSITAPSAASLEGDVRYLASDALEGRESGTRGYEAASQYVADRFAAVGLVPGAGDGRWFQTFDMQLSEYGDEAENTLTLTGPNAPEPFVQFDDYLASTLGNAKSGEITAPLVFVGHGFVDPRIGRDDFAGVDVKGKIAVALTGAPDFLNSEERAYFSAQRSKKIAAHGAVGMITLRTPEADKRFGWAKLVDYSKHSVGATWLAADDKPHNDLSTLEGYATLSPDASARLLAGQPLDFASALDASNSPKGRPKAFDMGMSATIRFEQRLSQLTSRNVVGMVRGTDPVLRDEYVVLSAHLDHLGIDASAKDGEDAITNGAMDNATGSAILIDVARRLVIEPPRRSVLFVALTAEEKGLVGSSYNARHPTVPADKVVANVNLDMPILTYPFTDVVAFGAERSTLFGAVKAATRRAGIALTPDPNPEEGLFTRSDHYSYVEQGVPSVYLMMGPANGGKKAFDDFLENHYHQPSDEPDLIDYRQAARFADLNFEIARTIANMDERPVWKKQDFFGTVFGGPMAN